MRQSNRDETRRIDFRSTSKWVNCQSFNHKGHEGARREPLKLRPSCNGACPERCRRVPLWFVGFLWRIVKLTHYRSTSAVLDRQFSRMTCAMACRSEERRVG